MVGVVDSGEAGNLDPIDLHAPCKAQEVDLGSEPTPMISGDMNSMRKGADQMAYSSHM